MAPVNRSPIEIDGDPLPGGGGESFVDRVRASQKRLATSVARAGLRDDAYAEIINALSEVMDIQIEFVNRMGEVRPISVEDVKALNREVKNNASLTLSGAIERLVLQKYRSLVLGALAVMVGLFLAGMAVGNFWPLIER
jgi:hypothetical protein